MFGPGLEHFGDLYPLLVFLFLHPLHQHFVLLGAPFVLPHPRVEVVLPAFADAVGALVDLTPAVLEQSPGDAEPTFVLFVHQYLRVTGHLRDDDVFL